jgi:hypothetical protein
VITVALLDTKGDTSAAKAGHAIVGEVGDDQVLRKEPVRKIRCFFAGQRSYPGCSASQGRSE